MQIAEPGMGVTAIALAVAFVLAAIIFMRSVFKRTLFPRVKMRDFVVEVIAGTIMIWAVFNVSFLGMLAGLGLILLVVVPSLLKLGPRRF